MGNLTTSFKKFLQNKNTVTVLGVILAIFILYFAYTMRVKSAINPITVPYASEQILSATQITQSMISTRQVPPSMLDGEVITNVGEIIDKYTAIDTIIPKGSLFYKRAVVEREQLPDDIILDYPKEHVLYQFGVDVYSTYGNSILPGNYVDIWISTRPTANDTNTVMVGKLISNVRILAVKDGSGRAVFQNMDENRTPAMVIFALNKELYELLTAAEKLKDTFNTTIKLVPTNESLKDDPGNTDLSSEELKKWINTHVQYVS